jgi:hypothetical protein
MVSLSCHNYSNRFNLQSICLICDSPQKDWIEMRKSVKKKRRKRKTNWNWPYKRVIRKLHEYMLRMQFARRTKDLTICECMYAVGIKSQFYCFLQVGKNWCCCCSCSDGCHTETSMMITHFNRYKSWCSIFIWQVTQSMSGVVKAMESAMRSMNLEKVQDLFNRFETEFENLDVHSSVSMYRWWLYCIYVHTGDGRQYE